MAQIANTYRVHFTLLVDHPELRSSTLPKVNPGHTSYHRVDCATLGEALAVADGIANGSEDFASECAIQVRIDRVRLSDGRPFTARKRVDLNNARMESCFFILNDRLFCGAA